MQENVKLQNFYRTVVQDAEQQRKKLLDEIDEIIKTQIEEKKSEALEDAYNYIQKQKMNIADENNSAISKAIIKSKKDILKKREDIFESVFGQITKRLESFIQSECEYKIYLNNAIKAALDELGQDGTTVYLLERDKKLVNCSHYKVQFEFGMYDFMGGCRAKSKNLLVEMTLDKNLEKQKDLFYKTSGLVINN